MSVGASLSMDSMPLNREELEGESRGQQTVMERQLMGGGPYVTQQIEGITILETAERSSSTSSSPMSAAGPRSLIAVVGNNVIRYDRDGTFRENVTHGTFFNVSSITSIAHAHILYHQYGEHGQYPNSILV